MTVRANPSIPCHSLVFRTPLCSSFQAVRQLGNVGTRRGATADARLTHPQMCQESRYCLDLDHQPEPEAMAHPLGRHCLDLDPQPEPEAKAHPLGRHCLDLDHHPEPEAMTGAPGACGRGAGGARDQPAAVPSK
jgi:hypothetical protein